MNHPALLLVLAASIVTPALAQDPAIKRVPTPYVSPASGVEMYKAYCASCHGPKGTGDGPVASHLKMPPGDLTLLAKNNKGVFPAARVAQVIRGEGVSLTHGTEDMPVWGPVFRSFNDRKESAIHQRVANLTKHIASLQAK